MGYGSDGGGGNTVALLRQVHNRFGVVASFTGTYRADEWTMKLSSKGLRHKNSGATTTTPPAMTTTTPKATLHRQKCKFNFCAGSLSKKSAACKDGYCVCTGQDYDYYTCLPDAYGCRIEINANEALAKPQYNNHSTQKIYSCTPGNSSTQYEVHVLAVNEAIDIRRPPLAGHAAVNIVSGEKSDRSLVLVLASREPVNWILNLQANVNINEVILVAYYVDESSVGGDVNQVQVIEKKGYPNSKWNSGYGGDAGGDETVRLLRRLHRKFGVVTSFTGTYKANQWSLALSSSQGLGFTNAIVTNPTTPVPPAIPTAILRPTLHQKRCSGSYDCPGSYEMNAVCKDGDCVCTGQYYDYNTCLPDAYGCRIFANTDKALAIPRYNNQPVQIVYSCTPGNSSTQYEVHVLSVYGVVVNRHPPDATVNVVRGGQSGRPIVLVLASYEPVNWILNLPADLIISKVILVAPYSNQSSVSGDVNRVNIVGHNRQWDIGYGSDLDGGDTVEFLKQVHNTFGVVTSFTGTYRADEWSWELSSPQGLSSANCLSQEIAGKCSGVSAHETLEKLLCLLVILLMISFFCAILFVFADLFTKKANKRKTFPCAVA